MMQRTKPHTFYDDYENDCVELWDAIQALQEKIKQLEKDRDELEMANDAPEREEDSR